MEIRISFQPLDDKYDIPKTVANLANLRSYCIAYVFQMADFSAPSVGSPLTILTKPGRLAWFHSDSTLYLHPVAQLIRIWWRKWVTSQKPFGPPINGGFSKGFFSDFQGNLGWWDILEKNGPIRPIFVGCLLPKPACHRCKWRLFYFWGLDHGTQLSEKVVHILADSGNGMVWNVEVLMLIPFFALV